jgi:hypothetical protein
VMPLRPVSVLKMHPNRCVKWTLPSFVWMACI